MKGTSTIVSKAISLYYSASLFILSVYVCVYLCTVFYVLPFAVIKDDDDDHDHDDDSGLFLSVQCRI